MKDRYDEWIAHVFEHQVTDPAWFFDLDAPDFEGEPEEIARLVERTCSCSGADIAGFTNAQVGLGLNYVFNPACSNFAFAILDDRTEPATSLAAIDSIKILYRDCFEPRCKPALGHESEPDASEKLNFICYMFWDIFPVVCWKGRAGKEQGLRAALDVLAFALNSPDIACVESALHGLGHVHGEGTAAMVEQIIGAAEPRRPARLLPYARAAAKGHVL
jgi:hypothetical protein